MWLWNKLYTKAPNWTPYKVLLWLEKRATDEEARLRGVKPYG